MANGAGVQLWGWDSTNSVWVKVLVNSDGKLIIDPSEIFENPPTDGETAKGAQSDWCYDHWKDAAAHHARYTDAEAIAAAKTDPLLLNYTQGARVYHSADQTLTTGVITTLAFDSERYDTDSIHDTVTNNSRLTCKTAGKYIIAGGAAFAANGASDRSLFIWFNQTVYIAYHEIGHGGFNPLTVSTIYELAVNDFVELRAFQASGGNLKVMALGNYTPEFMMQRIG